MEHLEKAAKRVNQARRNAVESERPVIGSIRDIQAALRKLDPSDRSNVKSPDVKLSVDLSGTEEGGSGRLHKHTFHVDSSSPTKSQRDIIIEGFNILKRRNDAVNKARSRKTGPSLVVDDKEMDPPSAIADEDVTLSIDPMIDRLLAGERRGYYICWDLPDGYAYKYEIFQHRLTRKLTENETNRDGAGAIRATE